MDSSIASLSHSEEIKPYKIHVSSKYLDLTRKKLELTRLPHELLLPVEREREHGTPKAEIEPLIDFWLEQYSWRARETYLNNELPQFRTALSLPSTSTPSTSLRIHFIHLRSPYTHATPLLLIPPFPLTPLSLASLYKPLTHPTRPSAPAFHLVIPSIPGLGFSDTFSTTTSQTTQLHSTAALFAALMQRLGYTSYLTSSTSSGRASPAHIDYHLARLIGAHDACLGVHYIAPPWTAPSFRAAPWRWLTYSVAWFWHAPIGGYTGGDFRALWGSTLVSKREKSLPLGAGSAGVLGLREPNTLAYALCDSPVGLLSLVCSALRRASPDHKLEMMEVVDVAQLAWLPGPEAGMRFWAGAVRELERGSGLDGANGELGGETKRKGKQRAAVTIFGADGSEAGYTPPAWAPSSTSVIFTQRVTGKAGLVAFERSEAIVAGIQGLAHAVAGLDKRLALVPFEGVVVDGEEREGEYEQVIEEVDEESSLQLDVERPDMAVAVD